MPAPGARTGPLYLDYKDYDPKEPAVPVLVQTKNNQTVNQRRQEREIGLPKVGNKNIQNSPSSPLVDTSQIVLRGECDKYRDY